MSQKERTLESDISSLQRVYELAMGEFEGLKAPQSGSSASK